MTKILSFLLLVLVVSVKSQTYHIQYNTYNNSSQGYFHSTAMGNGVYFCYNEDSLQGGSSGKYLCVQKNDLAGAVVWKKRFYTDTINVEPVRILSSGASLYIGGNYRDKIFITRLDTISGALSYFNLYTCPSVSNSAISANDMCFALPGQIAAVGAVSQGTASFLNVLRISAASGTIINNSFSTGNTDMVARGVCFYYNKLYIVGDNNDYPFIARYDLSNNNFLPAGGSTYTSGIAQPSSFYQIECSNSRIVCVGGLNAPAIRNFIFNVDTTAIGVSNSTVTGINVPSNYNFDFFTVSNNKVHVAGVFGGGTGVVTYTNDNFSANANTYSVQGVFSRLVKFKNSIYYSIIQPGMGSQFTVAKGDSMGVTVCTDTTTPVTLPMTLTATNVFFGPANSGSFTPINPVAATISVSSVGLCGITMVKEALKNNSFLVKNFGDKYEIVSESADVSSYQLMDINGRIVLGKNSLQSKSLQLDLETYSAGLYFLKLNCDNRIQTLKLIKQ